MGKLRINIGLLAVSATLLTGCMGIETQVVDELQLATAAGFKHIEDDEIEATISFPVFLTDKTVKNATLTATDTLNKELRDRQNLKSEKPIVSGKLEVILFDRQLAERGFFDHLDSLMRDPSIGSKVFVVVLEDDPKDVLSKQYGNKDTGIYLSNIIQQNIDTGLIPKTNLHLFTYNYYAEGKDPAIPIMAQSKDGIGIKALGLFKHDKLVYQIEKDELFFYKVLIEPSSSGETLAIKFNEDKKASIINVESTRKYEILQPMSNAEIKIKVKAKMMIREYDNGLLNENKMKEMEKFIKKRFEEKSAELIQQFQQKGTDPLGIGEQVRTRTRNWDKKKWDELYPNIPITVQAEIEMIESGLIN